MYQPYRGPSFKNKNSFASTSNNQRQSSVVKNKNASNNQNPYQKQAHNVYGKIDKKREDPMNRYTQTNVVKKGDPLQRYSKSKIKSMIPTRPMVKYELNSKNTFYEDSSDVKQLQMIKAARPIFLKWFLVLFILYYILSYVQPFQEYCPANASCGVYINCHPGYELKGDFCKITQEVLDDAQRICTSEIQTLKYQYGNTECLAQDDYKSLISPSRKIDQIIQRLQIQENRALVTEIRTWLDKRENQYKYKFSINQGKIYTGEKFYSFKCWMKKASEKSSAKYAALAFVVVLLGLFIWIREKAFKNKAKEIYAFLKEKVNKKGDLVIEKQDIEQVFGHLSLQMWTLVEFFRIKDGQIVYYIESDTVHWVKNTQ